MTIFDPNKLARMEAPGDMDLGTVTRAFMNSPDREILREHGIQIIFLVDDRQASDSMTLDEFRALVKEGRGKVVMAGPEWDGGTTVPLPEGVL